MNPDGWVLVVSQKGTSWLLPKGHIEENEDDVAAARREIYEESGVSELELIKPLGTYQRYLIGKDGIGEDPSHLKTIMMFLFRTTQNTLGPVDPDHPEARWVKKEEVAGLLMHAKDKEFITSVLPELV